MDAWLLTKKLSEDLEPITQRTRLILATDGGRPVLPSSAIAQGGQVAVGKRARELKNWIEIGGSRVATRISATEGVLPKGLTLEFKAREADADDGAGAGNRTISFCVSRDTADELTLSILWQRVEPTVHNLAGVVDQELIVLDRAPQVGKSPVFLTWRVQLARLKEHWVAVYLEALPHSDRGLDEAIAECKASLLQRAEEAQQRTSVVSPGEAQAIDLTNALESLALVKKRRAMIVNQAGKTGAGLALDLGLSATEAFLASYILRLLPELQDKKGEDLNPDKLAWILEKEAWTQLLLQLEADPPLPEMLALAVRHAGELARYPGMLQDFLESSKSLEGLHRRILMENRSILISNIPGPRIRASLWLESRGEDLGDYRPMDTQARRREAYVALVRRWEAEGSAKEKQK